MVAWCVCRYPGGETEAHPDDIAEPLQPPSIHLYQVPTCIRALGPHYHLVSRQKTHQTKPPADRREETDDKGNLPNNF